MKRVALVMSICVFLAWCALSVVVELEVTPRGDTLHADSGKRALIVFHPSWIDGFQQDLTLAFAEGFAESGWTVERVTASSERLPDPTPFDLVVFGTNTYYWRPDLPTKRVLASLRLQDKPCVGLVSGAGSTGRAERLLAESITAARGKVLEVRPFWLWRPNDESRMDEPNRAVAVDVAREFGRSVARRLAR